MMIEMKVFGLAVDENSQAPVLVLKDISEKVVLPIWIGAMEAMAISLSLNGVSLPRPMTHDLLLSTIRTLGAEVLAVEVVRLEEGTYFAEVEVSASGQIYRLDARPSDGVALALRAGVPIRVEQLVLDAAAVDESTLITKPVLTPGLTDEDAGKWNDLLEHASPEDKYKM